MQLNVSQAVDSLLRTGCLTAAIDRRATNQEQDIVDPYPGWNITLPASVVRDLLDRASNKKLHLGVLGLACRLHQPKYQPQFELLEHLAANGIDSDRLHDAMRYARSLGMLRKLFSAPYIGHRHKNRISKL